MAQVSVTKVDDDLLAVVGRAMHDAGCEGVISPGDSVLIKPNFNACTIRGSTNPHLVRAIALWAKQMGAGQVIIGEGPVPVGKERVDQYFQELGIHQIAQEVGADFVNFDEHEFMIHRDLSEDLPEEIGISRFVHECDKLINVPMLKIHPSTVVTLCMKNLKGCIRGQDKRAFHRQDLPKAITELNRLVRPDINFVDGITAMQGTNHNSGDLVELGLVFCSRDVVAVDAVASYCIGIPPAKIRLLKLGERAGLGELDLNLMDIRGEDLEASRTRFELPEEAMSRRFPDLRIQNKGACSGCMANLLDVLGWTGNWKTQTFVLGRDTPDAEGAILIGDCTSEYWGEYEHVAGCPPSSRQIAEVICTGSVRGTIYDADS